MSNFTLIKHIVGEASFVESSEKEKKRNIEVGVEGGVLIPKESDEKSKAVVQLTFHLGKENERIYLQLKTITIFAVTDNLTKPVSEEDVLKECLPIALAQLRKTVKNVMEAYGRPGIDLPPFEEENIE